MNKIRSLNTVDSRGETTKMTRIHQFIDNIYIETLSGSNKYKIYSFCNSETKFTLHHKFNAHILKFNETIKI
jgi:hypothetical protein